MLSAAKLVPLLGLSTLVASAPGCGCARDPKTATEAGAYEVTMDERFAFSPASLVCSPGQSLRLSIRNTIPPGGADIAHTFVLLRPGSDVEAFAKATVDASAEQNYIPTGFEDRVITSSPLVHPGKRVELVLAAPSATGDYPILCAFPGHCLLGMRGVLVVR